MFPIANVISNYLLIIVNLLNHTFKRVNDISYYYNLHIRYIACVNCILYSVQCK